VRLHPCNYAQRSSTVEVSGSGHSRTEADSRAHLFLALRFAEADRLSRFVPLPCHLVALISESDTMHCITGNARQAMPYHVQQLMFEQQRNG
jgi:hypothetical protein